MEQVGLYIDADNVSFRVVANLMNQVKTLGFINIKKIFGDWTQNELNRWKPHIENYGLESVQCFRHSKKQSTDIYLITELMSDLHLYTNLTKIILVSSDSDFTHLCHCVKKLGKKLVIVGHKNTFLRNHCDQFWDISQYMSNNNNNDNIINYKDIKVKSSKKTKTKTKLNNEIDYLSYFINALGTKYVLRISDFKKNLKNQIPKNHKLKWRKIELNLEEYPEYFHVLKTKKAIFVIYIYDLLNMTSEEFDNNIDYFKEEYNEVLKIISIEKLRELI